MGVDAERRPLPSAPSGEGRACGPPSAASVGECVELLKERAGCRDKQKAALLELAATVQESSAAAEEARASGAVQVLTRLLKSTDDEEVLDAASAVIAACSGPMAAANQLRAYRYGGLDVRVREGALGDGLGARVWAVAHMLCLELAGNTWLCSGREVLELGSGCGLCGLVAAAAGAARVVLSDVEAPVLRNLRACMHLNGAMLGEQGVQQVQLREAGAAGPVKEPPPHQQQQQQEGGATKAASSQHLLLQQRGSAPPSGAASAWDVGRASVRLLDWRDELRCLLHGASAPAAQAEGGACAAAACGVRAGTEGADGVDGGAAEDMPPHLAHDERFPVIIASEVVYEHAHAELVAGVVARRLAPGGAALLSCAVRELQVFQVLARECGRHGLRYRRRRVEPLACLGGSGGGGGAAKGGGTPAGPPGGGGSSSFEGILGHAHQYEGGIVMLALDHREAPFAHWHRDDWEDASVEVALEGGVVGEMEAPRAA